MERRVLLIYTGGTIGMIKKEDGSYGPFNFDQLLEQVPELKKLDVEVDNYSFEDPIDSSNMTVENWQFLATLLFEKRNDFDGFVVLHGSDTMAYSASAISFMLKDFNKPVIFTGSQLPIGIIRTDAKENLLTSVEIASSYDEEGNPVVPEVALYFEYHLYRGNRTIKINAELFDAFISPNYSDLAEAGVHINYKYNAIAEMRNNPPELRVNMCQDVAILKLFPGMNAHYVKSVISQPNLKGLVLETFGSGNAPTAKWFVDLIEEAINKGILVVNVTQCVSGSVEQGRYETSSAFNRIGVIPAQDMTTESAITKLMYILGNYEGREKQVELFLRNIRGEVTGENLGI